LIKFILISISISLFKENLDSINYFILLYIFNISIQPIITVLVEVLCLLLMNTTTLYSISKTLLI
jgi:hypothetical protein